MYGRKAFDQEPLLEAENQALKMVASRLKLIVIFV
jgi:hypothetical protein